MIQTANRKGAWVVLVAAMLLLSFSNVIAATIPISKWKMMPAYGNATKVLKAFDRIYVLNDGSLYCCVENEFGAEIHTYNKNGGLSDVNIADIAFCEKENTLVLVYANGNIDLLENPDEMVNCPDIILGNPGNINIGRMYIDNSLAYIPIGAGLVTFDIAKKEIRGFYRFTSAVNAVTVLDNSIYCAVTDSIMTAPEDCNLLDPVNWKTVARANFTGLVSFQNEILACSALNKVYKINTRTGAWPKFLDNLNAMPNVDNSVMFVCRDSMIDIYHNFDNIVSYKMEYPSEYAIISDGNCYTANGLYGISRYSFDEEDNLSLSAHYPAPNGPRRNAFHYITWPEPGKMLAISGCQNYQGIEWPGTVMEYENDKWNFYDDNIQQITGHKYIDLTEAVQDPDNPSRVFAGSARQGLYEFDNGKFVKNHTWDNSGLTSILDHHQYDFVSVSSLMFDKSGNLWMTNNEVDTIIKVLKADGSWKGLYYPEIAGIPTFKQMKQDNNGVIWINSSRGLKPGIVALDYGNTIDNQKDDIIRYSGSIFTNQDGKSEEIYDLFCYEFDIDGKMWLCTNRGIFVLPNPSDFLTDHSPVFERIKINRNDGSGLADYLFEGVMTTAIHIDEGNRKWIGTMDNGVYLLSEDGTRTLEHFTVDNSSLPSNNILFISEDALNGSLFFATDLGLVQYGGQARQAEMTLQKENMTVYPNPVIGERDEYVTITGLTQDCIVKFTDSKGHLVFQAEALGGSLSWNLKDFNGNEISSGVYHAIATDGNISKTVSITVIR